MRQQPWEKFSPFIHTLYTSWLFRLAPSPEIPSSFLDCRKFNTLLFHTLGFFPPFPSKTCFESPLFFFFFFPQTSPSAEVAGPCSLHLSFHHALLYVISLVSSQRRCWVQQASQSGKQSFLFCVQGKFLYKKIAQSINICCEQRH